MNCHKTSSCSVKQMWCFLLKLTFFDASAAVDINCEGLKSTKWHINFCLNFDLLIFLNFLCNVLLDFAVFKIHAIGLILSYEMQSRSHTFFSVWLSAMSALG